MADGKLIFDTAIDKSGFEKGTEQLKRTAAKAGGSITDFIAGNLLAAGISDVASGLVDIGRNAIEAASGLKEVQNVVDVTFGADAGKVETWAAEARKQYGLTELAAKQYTSTLGAMLKSMGLGSKPTLEMSTAMAGLAADMASFYNLDFDTAFEKIRSGIAGETEPLKQLGINMSVANMEAFALSQGVTKAYQSMTQAEQATLRYQYLMHTTADAQGDFARTSDGLANGLRVLETNWNTLLTNVGEVLEPVASGAVELLNGVLEGLTGGADKTEDLGGALRGTVADIETQAMVARHLTGELAALGDYSSLTAEEQMKWKAIAGELIRVAPELSGEIDVQAGSFRNGADAINAHIEAMEKDAKAQAVLETRKSIVEKAVTANRDYYETLAKHEAAYTRYVAAREALAKKEAEIQKEYGVEDGAALEAVLQGADPSRLNALVQAYGESTLTQEVAQWRDLTSAIATAQGESEKLYTERVKLGEQAAQMTEASNAELAALDAYADTLGVEVPKAADDAGDGLKDVGSEAGGLTGILEALAEPAGKVRESLEELSHYRLENLAQVRSELEQTFDTFDRPGRVRKQNLNKDTKNLEAQAEYWERYDKAVTALQEREGGDAWVAELADGSEESLGKLEALAAASDDAYSKATAAKDAAQANMESAAEAVSQSQLEVDGAYQQLKEDAASAIEGMNMQGEAYAAAASTGKGLIDGLMSKAPGLSAAVGALKNILSGLGAGLSIGGGFTAAPKLATGLAYVPYNEFPALLHEGEAVLTKAEAGLWRAGWAGARAVAAGPSAPSGAAGGGSFQQVNNFNVPVQTPDEFAKTMRLYATYGMEGAV